jgi:hypothetical protein
METVTLEIELPVEALALLDQIIDGFGCNPGWDSRQELIETAVMHRLVVLRDLDRKAVGKKFENDVDRLYEKWCGRGDKEAA